LTSPTAYMMGGKVRDSTSSAMPYQFNTELRAAVFTIGLARAPVNVLRGPMMSELANALDDAERLLARIIQPVARGDEKMQFERYDIV